MTVTPRERLRWIHLNQHRFSTTHRNDDLESPAPTWAFNLSGGVLNRRCRYCRSTNTTPLCGGNVYQPGEDTGVSRTTDLVPSWRQAGAPVETVDWWACRDCGRPFHATEDLPEPDLERQIRECWDEDEHRRHEPGSSSSGRSRKKRTTRSKGRPEQEAFAGGPPDYQPRQTQSLETKTELVRWRVTGSQKSFLEREARARGMAVSELMEQAVLCWAREHCAEVAVLWPMT